MRRARGEIVTTLGTTLGSSYKTSGSSRYRHQSLPRVSRGNWNEESREKRIILGAMFEFVGGLSWTSRTSCYSCILVFFVFLLSCTTAEYDTRDVASGSSDRTQDNDFRSCTEGKCIKRTTQEISSGMWFGPRLGKRRKFESKTEMDTELEAIVNSLDGSRWALVTVPDDKRRTNRARFDQEGDYEEDLSNNPIPKDTEDPRENNEAQTYSFAISRGGRHVPWSISSRFAHRSRFPTL